MTYQRGSVSFTRRLKLDPVVELTEPVDCTPVSKPPAFGTHGPSKVDSATEMRFIHELLGRFQR